MKKNILVLIICIIIILGIIVLGIALNNSTIKTDKIKVVTSFYPMYIASLNLVDGIEEIDLQNLTSNATGCTHDYTLTPQEMMNLVSAKAIVINGSGMEDFLNDVIINYSNLNVIDTSIGVETLEEEKHGVNPHTFVSLENYVLQVQNLYDGLVQIFPEFEQKLTINKDKYITELNELKDYGITKLKNFEGSNIVALHESFEYFAKDFGINVIAVIEEEEGTATSATDIVEIIENVKSQYVNAIITEKDASTNTANIISRETGIDIIEFDSALTGKNEKSAYVNAYKENIDKIANALNGGV